MASTIVVGSDVETLGAGADNKASRAEDNIAIYSPLRVFLCLGCGVGIKPGMREVESYYRRRYRMKGAELRDTLALAGSLSSSSSPPLSSLAAASSLPLFILPLSPPAEYANACLPEPPL